MRECGSIRVITVTPDKSIEGVRFCVSEFGAEKAEKNNRWNWMPSQSFTEFYFADEADAIVFRLAMGV